MIAFERLEIIISLLFLPFWFQIDILIGWVGILAWGRVQGSGLQPVKGSKIHDPALRTHASCRGPSTYKQADPSFPRTHQCHPSSSSEAQRDRQRPTSSTSKMLVVWSLVLQLSCLIVAIPSIQGVSQVKLQQSKYDKMYNKGRGV